jgi:hypothetical protein
MMTSFRHRLDLLLALAAALAVGAALFGLMRERANIVIEPVMIDGTPATIFRPAGGAPAPTVLIAHGFAGSQQLMQAFALNAARNGVSAVTFDFLGHARNPAPLGGSVNEIGGATRALVGQTARMLAFARTVGDGRVALLGHSMASDIIIRTAQADGDIAATVAISAFSQVVTPSSPRNLLLIAGAWEGRLVAAALRLVAQVAGPEAKAGVTYGDIAQGTARRFVSAPGVEHVGVLYSRVSIAEAQGWLAATFGLPAPAPPPPTGWLILLLLGGLILSARPLSRLLPVLGPPTGGGLPWRRFWIVLLLPAALTPLILRVAPTQFLPVLVADYLAVHLALYGALTFAALKLAGGSVRGLGGPAAMLLACIGAVAITFGGLFFALDIFVTSLRPIPQRIVLIGALMIGAASYAVATEWAMRGPAAARLAGLAVPIALLASLAAAVALDPKRLFFLAVIVPVIVPFLAVFGLFGRWVYSRTGHPLPGAAAQATALAIAMGATFPMLTG